MYKTKALVLFSGGLDSTTCLFWAMAKFKDVHVLMFDYGQRHIVEQKCAKHILDVLKFKRKQIHEYKTDLFTQVNDSALLGYADVNARHRGDKDLPASFVPGRNIVFLTIASMVAYKNDIHNIVIGVNQQDYSGYPDCRQVFIDSMNNALVMGLQYAVKIHAPIIEKTKADIIKLGADMSMFEFIRDNTHSCYNGVHDKKQFWGYGCGKCESCKLRRQGYTKYINGGKPL